MTVPELSSSTAWWWIGAALLVSIGGLVGVLAWARRRITRDARQMTSLLGYADCLLWQADVERLNSHWRWRFSVQNTSLSRRIFGENHARHREGLWDHLSVPEWPEMCARATEALESGRAQYEQEFHFEHGGETIWLKESVSLHSDGLWKRHLVGLVTDITKERQAEVARQASEERVRQLLSRADCMLWEARVVALDGGDFQWEWFIPRSELYRRLTGDTSSPTRMPWNPTTVPEFTELQTRSRRAMLQGLPGYEQEFRVVLNNAVLWMHEQVTVKPAGPGQWQMQGVVIDITAQRQAEESKRASEAQLRQIMDTANFLLWHARVFVLPDGKTEWVLNVPTSVLYRRIFGRDPQHPIALPWNELVSPERFAEMGRQSQRALMSGSDGYDQEFLARRGHQQFWLHEQATIRSLGPGEWQVVGIVTDVTVRHLAEEARAASERALHEILERVDCMLWRATVNRSGDQLVWTQFHLPESRLRSELLGQHLPGGTPELWNYSAVPELAEMNLRSTAAIFAGASGYEQEFRWVKDDRTFWLNEQVTIIPVSDGEWHAVGVVTNITQQHEAKEAQRRSDRRLEELLQRADCLIWQGRMYVGADGQIQWDVYVPPSRLFRRIFDRDPNENGFEWDKIHVPEFHRMMVTAREALMSDRPGYEHAFHVPKAGGDIWLTEQVSVTPTGPNQWEAVGVITDITARHEAEQAQRASQAQLQQILELADCMVWHADVVRKDGRLHWSVFSPHSVLHNQLFGHTDLRQSIDWRRLNVPELAEIDARAERAIRGADRGYSQEFRVVFTHRVVWLHEAVTITRIGPDRFTLVGVVTDITAQREAQEAHRASVAQVEQMLENADCMLWQARVFAVSDGNERWVMFLPRSRLHQELFGRDPLDPPGIPWHEVVDPVTEREIKQRARTAIFGGERGYAQEFRAQRGNRVFWLHEQVSITALSPGEWQLVGVVTDLTARREAEQAVRASELRYRTLYQHTPVAIVEADFTRVGDWLRKLRQEGITDLRAFFEANPEQVKHAAQLAHFVDCNASAMTVLRAKSKRDFRWRRALLATPDSIAMIRSALLSLWDGHNTLETAMKIRDFDGGLHDMDVRWWLELTEAGLDFRQSVMVLVDVTELKQAEAELAAEKERLAVTLRAMAEGVITTDVSGRIQYMNPAAVAFTGWSVESALGRPVGDVCVLENERTGERFEVPVLRVARGDIVRDLPPRTRLSTADGAGRLVEGCCAPIHSAASEVIGTVLVFRDVTEHERLEQELIRATKLESVGILAGGIAHDFNNILTAVMGNVALALLDAEPNSSVASSLREAEKATLRARDLTQQLLTFAKGGEPVREAVRLDGIVREITTFTLHGSQVRADYDMPEGLWPADADKGQMGRVVQNMVLNAVQAMPEGGIVHISLRNELVDGLSKLALPPGKYVQIAISDTGVGIRPEHLTRIFDPYFTTKQKGSGLGLAAVYSIVNKHRGSIDVQSQLGVGTTFRIWLPASLPHDADHEGSRPLLQNTVMHGRVLFMDDEEPIRQMANFLLRRFGFDVVCAADGADAVKKYAEAREEGNPFSLVIMDLTVPGGMGGRQAVTQLRMIDPKVRAIVSSGYSSDPVLANYRAHGFCGVVAKPYEVADFARVLREALASDPSAGQAPG